MATIEVASKTKHKTPKGYQVKLLVDIKLDRGSRIPSRRTMVDGRIFIVNLHRDAGKETTFLKFPAVIESDVMPAFDDIAIKVNVIDTDGSTIAVTIPPLIYIKDAEDV